jgi:hypothetical protein
LIEIFVDRPVTQAEDVGNIAVGLARSDPEQHVGPVGADKKVR